MECSLILVVATEGRIPSGGEKHHDLYDVPHIDIVFQAITPFKLTQLQ